MYGDLYRVCPCCLSAGAPSLVGMRSIHCGGASITGARESDTYRPRLGRRCLVVFEIIMMYLSLQRI